jgi:hypothetical protein
MTQTTLRSRESKKFHWPHPASVEVLRPNEAATACKPFKVIHKPMERGPGSITNSQMSTRPLPLNA